MCTELTIKGIENDFPLISAHLLDAYGIYKRDSHLIHSGLAHKPKLLTSHNFSYFNIVGSLS